MTVCYVIKIGVPEHTQYLLQLCEHDSRSASLQQGMSTCNRMSRTHPDKNTVRLCYYLATRCCVIVRVVLPSQEKQPTVSGPFRSDGVYSRSSGSTLQLDGVTPGNSGLGLFWLRSVWTSGQIQSQQTASDHRLVVILHVFFSFCSPF